MSRRKHTLYRLDESMGNEQHGGGCLISIPRSCSRYVPIGKDYVLAGMEQTWPGPDRDLWPRGPLVRHYAKYGQACLDFTRLALARLTSSLR